MAKAKVNKIQSNGEFDPKVSVKGEESGYKLIENMDGGKETVKVVSMDNWGRYDLLKAWVRNWEQNSMGFRSYQ